MQDKLSGASVTLNTWGTTLDRKTGIAHAFDNALFGGNCGHASLSLTFPVNDQSTGLIEEYCYGHRIIKGKPNEKKEKIIPFERITIQVMGDDGKPKDQDVYVLYFSWWDRRKNRYGQTEGLIRNINEDNLLERPGAPIPELSERFKDLDLEKRVFSGVLGNQKITQAPYQIIHLRKGLTPEQEALLNNELTLIKLDNEEKRLASLHNKFSQDVVKISSSIKKFVTDNPELNLTLEGKVLTAEQKRILQNSINQKINKNKEDLDKIRSAIENSIGLVSPEPNKEKIKEFSERKAQEGVDPIVHVQAKLSVLKSMNSIYKKPPQKPEESAQEYRARLNEYYEALTSGIKAVEEEIDNLSLTQGRKSFSAQNYQNFVSLGHTPDSQVHLRVTGLKENEANPDGGLNIECMLKKMKEFAILDGDDFDILDKNCSSTVGAILEAGVDEKWKNHFNRKALGTFGTPQEVLNKTIQYDHAVRRRRGIPNLNQTISSNAIFHSITTTAGDLINKAVTEIAFGTSQWKKALVGTGLVLISPLVLVGFTANSLLNPRRAFKNCISFIEYAGERNSLFLKTIGIPIAIATATILAVPAGIQYAFKKAFRDPIKKRRLKKQIKNEILSSKIETETYINNSLNVDEPKVPKMILSNQKKQTESHTQSQSIPSEQVSSDSQNLTHTEVAAKPFKVTQTPKQPLGKVNHHYLLNKNEKQFKDYAVDIFSRDHQISENKWRTDVSHKNKIIFSKPDKKKSFSVKKRNDGVLLMTETPAAYKNIGNFLHTLTTDEPATRITLTPGTDIKEALSGLLKGGLDMSKVDVKLSDGNQCLAENYIKENFPDLVNALDNTLRNVSSPIISK